VLEELLAVLYRPITDKMELLMSEVEATKAKVEALSGQIDEMQTRVVEDVDALKAKVEDLSAQLVEEEIDTAVLEEINAGLDNISQRVQSIDPDPANPAPNRDLPQ
jgi:SMC interacting uncharacterized protein involved in chromosome segregation